MEKSLSLLLCTLACGSLIAQEADQPAAPISPEVVEQQLDKAEHDFQVAKEMIDPWYTGPLLTPSSNIVPAGSYNIQPYLFVTDNFAAFDKHGHSHDFKHDRVQMKEAVVFQFGLTQWMNGVFTPQLVRNNQNHHTSVSFGDTTVGLNFGLLKETAYRPGLVFAVAESFPSGVYQNLNPKKGGVDSTGSGSYSTTFSLVVGKVVWWWFPKHPMRFRFAASYQLNSNVHVEGFNSYGGTFDTHGTVKPGGTATADFGYEYSFNQHWVFALDAIYYYTWKTSFHGHHGVDATGVPVPVGGPFNDGFQLAPAIEYNVNANLGFIAGIWFTPWGRNSTDFISGVFSFTYTW